MHYVAPKSCLWHQGIGSIVWRRHQSRLQSSYRKRNQRITFGSLEDQHSKSTSRRFCLQQPSLAIHDPWHGLVMIKIDTRIFHHTDCTTEEYKYVFTKHETNNNFVFKKVFLQQDRQKVKVASELSEERNLESAFQLIPRYPRNMLNIIAVLTRRYPNVISLSTISLMTEKTIKIFFYSWHRDYLRL